MKEEAKNNLNNEHKFLLKSAFFNKITLILDSYSLFSATYGKMFKVLLKVLGF